jgi:hypothetical protein
VVGTRGSMPKATFDSLREINFYDFGSYTTISLLALRPLIDIPYLHGLQQDGKIKARVK